MKKKIKFCILFLLIFICFRFIKGFVVIDIKPKNITKKQWIEDLIYLKSELPKKHINLYFDLEENKYFSLIDNVKNSVENLSDDEIEVGIMSILAQINDRHTFIKGLRTKNKYPFEFYWFKEGIFFTKTSENFNKLLGKKLIKINGQPIDEIIKKVNTLIPSENNTVMYKAESPKYIIYPAVLAYFKIIDTPKTIFTFEDLNGVIENIEVEPIKNNNSIKYISLLDNLKEKPFYLQNHGDYWHEYSDENKILYLKLNGLLPLEKKYRQIVDESLEILKEKQVDKFIVDLRDNTGGAILYNNNLATKVAEISSINKKGKLFVIVGRETFSAGVDLAKYFKDKTEAIIYGEITKGNINCYGDMRYITLPNSKLAISYSTKLFGEKATLSPIVPEYINEPSIKDYINGIDPNMDNIIKCISIH